MSLLDVQRLARYEGVPFLGEPFSPSSDLLGRGLSELKRSPHTEEAFARYRDGYPDGMPGFMAELRANMTREPLALGWLLARRRVVLMCFCPSPERCHRSLVANALVKCGARYRGELS